jgi:Tol biopolymer transport system component
VRYEVALAANAFYACVRANRLQIVGADRAGFTDGSIGSVSAASFSPDGRWLSVISNVSGLPQVYAIPAVGAWPRMITDGVDPVVSAVWSPAAGSNWLALTIAPGSGLNTQVCVVRSDGTGLRRLTDGAQDNNALTST